MAVTNFGVFGLFSFGGYGLALAALAVVVFGAYDSYPPKPSIGVNVPRGLPRREVEGCVGEEQIKKFNLSEFYGLS